MAGVKDNDGKYMKDLFSLKALYLVVVFLGVENLVLFQSIALVFVRERVVSTRVFHGLLKVAIYVRVYMIGLPVQLNLTGKPERECVKTGKQLFRYVLYSAQIYLTGVTEQANLSGIHYRVW